MNEILFSPPHHRWPSKVFFKKLIWSAASACALGGLYGWGLERRFVRIERRSMNIAGLGEGFIGAKLAHISDLHCSPIVRERYLRECVELINSFEVDFVAITGDFITGSAPYAHRVGRVLSHLKPKIATLACLGNHDYGILHPRGLGTARGLADRVAEHLTRADVFVMMNECRIFRRGRSVIQFVGVEDFWSARYDPYMAFELARRPMPTIALSHNPDSAQELARMGAHWVLSGHTHGARMGESKLSKLIVPAKHQTFLSGQYTLINDNQLYVNRGLGYGRRFCLDPRPEITLFTLCEKTLD